MISASLDDVATMGCFLEHQDTRHTLTKQKYPEQEKGEWGNSPAKSASKNVTREQGASIVLRE
jgi:hypothetical protein